jgi:ADP-ribosylglycohydrolase
VRSDTAAGSLFGLASGDALGGPTEFLTVEQIHQRYGPGGPRELIGDPALVTDDTQMALAVAWALQEAPAPEP